MRAYKTVNDSYIEPISFTVPRRAEAFQADIFPPAVGVKPTASAKEWLDGKTGVPSKIDFESIYEGSAPKEVPSDYKAPSQATPAPVAKPAPKAEEPKEAPKPAAAVRSPPPSMSEQKGSIAAMANKYQDNEPDDEEEEDDETSSFEEISRPAQRTAMPVRSEPMKPAAEAAPPAAAIKMSSPAKTPVGTSTPTPTASAPSGAGVESSLDQIKQLIETQTKIITTQNDKISLLASEFEALKRKVGSGSQDQSERIRQLELELEEARS